MSGKKSLWEQTGYTKSSPKKEEKKKVEKKSSNGLWSKLKSKFKGPKAAEAGTGFAKRMKKGMSGE
jgi:hypothetical protein